MRHLYTFRCPHGHRRGSALIQMIVTVAIMGLLMTISGTALVRMYRQQSLQLERIARTSALQRLTRAFRDDVHAARGVSLVQDDGSQLVVAHTNETITWIVADDSIRRVVSVVGSELQPRTEPDQLAGETYRFPEARLQFDITGASEDGEFAVLEVTSPEPFGIAKPSVNHIEALVGRDLKFSVATVASN